MKICFQIYKNRQLLFGNGCNQFVKNISNLIEKKFDSNDLISLNENDKQITNYLKKL